jgi:hypothetical protein
MLPCLFMVIMTFPILLFHMSKVFLIGFCGWLSAFVFITERCFVSWIPNTTEKLMHVVNQCPKGLSQKLTGLAVISVMFYRIIAQKCCLSRATVPDEMQHNAACLSFLS